MPVQPWQDTALDLLGPMPDGEYILAIVDYYSRFFDIAIVKDVTTTSVINCLNRIFACHGYPVSIKTDNGRQFRSQQFESYLHECGIEHRLSPALWPQANGEIERQNRIMLKSMRIAHAQGKDWRQELFKTLLSHRATPHESTGVTPSKLMFGREIRTKLPELRDDTPRVIAASDRDSEQKQKGKDYADQRRNAKESDLNIGDQVLMQQEKRNKLSTRFSEKPVTIVDKTGSKVTVKSEDGRQFDRNSAHLKKFEEAEDVDMNQDTAEDILVSEETSTPITPQDIVTTRTGRVVKPPAKFNDFVKLC